MSDPAVIAQPAGLSQTLKDIDGAFSSKRVGTFVALGLLATAVGVDLFQAMQAGRPPSEFVFNALVWIVGGGFATATLERFAPKVPPAPAAAQEPAP